MDIINRIQSHSLLLAPMAGVSDSAFRQVCRRFGADIVYTEMISAKALVYKDKRTYSMLRTKAEEQPVIVQLFGHEPEVMAKAAKIAEQTALFCAIDINMGCPAPKIVNNQDGCALMKSMDTACSIVEKTAATVSLPVTVKFRMGFDETSKNAVSFARGLFSSGARALCIHGRLGNQTYGVPADIGFISEVVKSLPIPVIANGDVSSPLSCADMYQKTGCASVMIGRGAMGNPFIFSAIRHFEKYGALPPPPSVKEKMNTALWHIELMCQNKGERSALREARKHMAWYLKGMKGAALLRGQVNNLCTLSDLKALIERVIAFEKEDSHGA